MFKSKETWNSWSSWSSPVGLGFFYLTTALAIAIMLYTLLNIVVTVATVSHAPEYQGYPMDQGAPVTVPTSSGQ